MSFGLFTALEIEDVPRLLNRLSNNYRHTQTRRYPHLWGHAADLIEEAAQQLDIIVEQAKKEPGYRSKPRQRVKL